MDYQYSIRCNSVVSLKSCVLRLVQTSDCSEAEIRRSCLHRKRQQPLQTVVYEHLKSQRADILVTHEAGSAHPHGFAAIDELARAMGVARTFHGHHHNQFDYSADRARLGFSAFGVGFRGIVDIDGRSSNQ